MRRSRGKHKALAEVQRRCREAQIPCTPVPLGRSKLAVQVAFPALGGRASIVIEDLNGADDYPVVHVLEASFEGVHYLLPYNAIFNSVTGEIEGLVDTDDLYDAARVMNDRPHDEVSRDFPARTFAINATVRGKPVELSKYSRLLSALSYTNNSAPSCLSLKLRTTPGSPPEAALVELEAAAHALFFEVDRRVNIPFFLRRFPAALEDSAPSFCDGAADLGLHSSLGAIPATFEREPLMLYWHARRTWRLPLLHFVAMYQVVEYYFPRFSNATLREKISAVLRAPDFRCDEDRCVAALAALVRKGTKRGYGDERAQLRDTLRACVPLTELRRVLRDGGAPAVQLTSSDLSVSPIDPEDPELQTTVADRLYKLRCRIVHTKAAQDEDDLEPIFPASEESGRLRGEIALVRWVAERVLVAAASLPP